MFYAFYTIYVIYVVCCNLLYGYFYYLIEISKKIEIINIWGVIVN